MKIKRLIGYGLTVVTLSALATSAGMVAWEGSKAGREALSEAAQQKLVATRNFQKRGIEDYFEQLNTQIITYSNNEMIIEAMKAFSQAANLYTEEVDGPGNGDDLERYYRQEFETAYRSRNADRPLSARLLSELDELGAALQSAYIGQNPHPLGSKDRLDTYDDGSSYAVAHQRFHHRIRQFQQSFGFYDVFLVEPERGRIVYSVFKEVDFATTLTDGPLENSGISNVFNAANAATQPDFVSLTDFQPYAPSYQDPASFIASPIFDGEHKVGVLIFQMPIGKINKIMTMDHHWEASGLGQSGEVYLVGADRRMRSNSRFLIEAPEEFATSVRENGIAPDLAEAMIRKQTAIGLMPIETESASAALSNKSGVMSVTDYRGEKVLSAYAPLALNGLDWAILAELDEQEAYAPVASFVKKMMAAAAIVMFVVGIVTILLGRAFAEHLSRPLTKSAHHARRIAKGQLIKLDPVKTQANEVNEMFQSFSVMTDRLSTMVSDIQSEAYQLKGASQQIADGNLDLAKRTEEQAISLEKTASAVDQLTSTAASNAQNAQNANRLASDMRASAALGQDAMAEVVAAMEQIKDSSTKISEIVRVVEEIAFQTNLLALNAAVEAARAGDHGKGFAVVASEVRNLAQRSSTAVKEIEALIKESVSRVGSGSTQVESAGEHINEILLNVEKVLEVMHSITSATDEQAKGLLMVNDSIQEIDGITQMNAAMVEEAAVSTRALGDLASSLDVKAGNFTIEAR